MIKTAQVIYGPANTMMLSKNTRVIKGETGSALFAHNTPIASYEGNTLWLISSQEHYTVETTNSLREFVELYTKENYDEVYEFLKKEFKW